MAGSVSRRNRLRARARARGGAAPRVWRRGAVVGSCLDVLDLFPTEYRRIRAERFQLLDDK